MLRRLAQLLGEQSKLSVDPGENGYFFVRRVRGDAAAFRRELLRAGVDAGVGSEVADFCGDLGRAAECPHARDAHDRAIQLPLHEGLEDRDLVRIAELCRDRVEL
jgi:dTDP-4-amino-4,6-dideoxygalactose transaminase